MILFPRFHLLELEDQSWCPVWLREYVHVTLAYVWSTQGLLRSSTTASQACDLLLSTIPELASFVIVDACAGAGGPTPILERTLNTKLRSQGLNPVQFLLADWYPHLDAWKEIVKKSDYISYIENPVDATRTKRYVPNEGGNAAAIKECRMFNLCFHHFDDDAARKVLGSAIEDGGSDAFVIFELSHRTLSSLLNTTLVILAPLITSLLWFWYSPLHLIFTYVIPIVPFFFAWDGYVSCIRGRTPQELRELIQSASRDRNVKDLGCWEFRSGETLVLPPFGYLYWFVGVKKTRSSS